MKQIIIQGDVMLYPVDAVPAGAETKAGDVHVLAYGEVTGHHHDLSGATLAVLEGERYVEAGETARLDHPDHGPVVIPAGAYRVIQQTEPDLLGGFRSVAD
jgi:quercetin dioxygenase-like cupin family protein